MKREISIKVTPASLFVMALLFAFVALAAPLWGPIEIPALFKAKVDVRGVLSTSALDAGVQSKVGGVNIGALVAIDGGVATRSCQFSYGAMTASALAVTFNPAFTSNPQCQCTHVNTTNTNPCTLASGSVPTPTTANFAVASGGTDVVHWLCCGDI